MAKVKSVRLHHSSLKSCTYVVEIPNKPYPTPYPCGLCKMYHQNKSLHLHLNQHGDVCVSKVIYQQMVDGGYTAGLIATKEVEPAPTVLDMSVSPQLGQYSVIHANAFTPRIVAGEGWNIPPEERK